jgi:hypothetical protein
MKVYTCIFTGVELCTDSSTMEEVENVAYRIKAKMIEIGNEDCGVAMNVDEDAAEGATAEAGENQKEKKLDLVHYQRLTETSYDKASFMSYLKKYMAKIKATISDEAAQKTFMQNAQKFMAPLMKNFDELSFFLPPIGDDQDPEDTMLIVCLWEGGEVPYFYFWKDGMKGTRV